MHNKMYKKWMAMLLAAAMTVSNGVPALADTDGVSASAGTMAAGTDTASGSYEQLGIVLEKLAEKNPYVLESQSKEDVDKIITDVLQTDLDGNYQVTVDGALAEDNKAWKGSVTVAEKGNDSNSSTSQGCVIAVDYVSARRLADEIKENLDLSKNIMLDWDESEDSDAITLWDYVHSVLSQTKTDLGYPDKILSRFEVSAAKPVKNGEEWTTSYSILNMAAGFENPVIVESDTYHLNVNKERLPASVYMEAFEAPASVYLPYGKNVIQGDSPSAEVKAAVDSAVKAALDEAVSAKSGEVLSEPAADASAYTVTYENESVVTSGDENYYCADVTIQRTGANGIVDVGTKKSMKIEVVRAEVESVELLSGPENTQWEFGDTSNYWKNVDYSGMQVRIHYTDGEAEVLEGAQVKAELDNAQGRFSMEYVPKTKTQVLGTYALSLTYGDKTGSVDCGEVRLVKTLTVDSVLPESGAEDIDVILTSDVEGVESNAEQCEVSLTEEGTIKVVAKEDIKEDESALLTMALKDKAGQNKDAVAKVTVATDSGSVVFPFAVFTAQEGWEQADIDTMNFPFDEKNSKNVVDVDGKNTVSVEYKDGGLKITGKRTGTAKVTVYGGERGYLSAKTDVTVDIYGRIHTEMTPQSLMNGSHVEWRDEDGHWTSPVTMTYFTGEEPKTLDENYRYVIYLDESQYVPGHGVEDSLSLDGFQMAADTSKPVDSAEAYDSGEAHVDYNARYYLNLHCVVRDRISVDVYDLTKLIPDETKGNLNGSGIEGISLAQGSQDILDLSYEDGMLTIVPDFNSYFYDTEKAEIIVKDINGNSAVITVPFTWYKLGKVTGTQYEGIKDGISMVSSADKERTYKAGEKYRNNLFIQYNRDGKTEKLPVTERMMSGFDTESLGDKTVQVNYGKDGRTEFVMFVSDTADLKESDFFIDDTCKDIKVTGGNADVTMEYQEEDKNFVVTSKNAIANTTVFEVTYTVGNTRAAAQVSVKTNEKGLITSTVITPGEGSVRAASAQWVKVPKTNYYRGETLDVTSGKIKITYNNGESKEVALTAAMVSGFNGSKPGSQKLTVTYEGVTADYNVSVTEHGDVTGSWKKNSTGWWYQKKDGSWPHNCWYMIQGTWYHFNAKGYMETGWLKLGNTWYYLKSSGAMATGWLKLGSTWYYLKDSGAMVTGWLKLGNTWYYLKSSGAMATGWIKVGSTWYYLKGSGAMATGWIQLGRTWYYLKDSGAMATGWLKPGNTWYYLKSSGAMATGWLKLGRTWYYLKGSGAMATGWVKSGKYWYYLKESGAMATGWLKLGNTWYYLRRNNGDMETGWQKIGGKWYYFYSSGAMAVNTKIGNYTVGANGVRK